MWLLNNKPIGDEDLSQYIGFVYLITNNDTGRKYIGRKLFKFRKTKTVKGKKKKVLHESDWRDYWGSNKVLQEEVKLNGEQAYKREIIHLCRSKGELSYYELREQITNDVLFKPQEYYNSYVGARIHRKHVLASNTQSF